MSSALVKTFTDSSNTDYTTVVNKQGEDILVIQTVKSRDGHTSVNQITLNKDIRAKVDWMIGDEFKNNQTVAVDTTITVSSNGTVNITAKSLNITGNINQA